MTKHDDDANDPADALRRFEMFYESERKRIRREANRLYTLSLWAAIFAIICAATGVLLLMGGTR